MKHTGTCPKCGGTELLYVEGKAGAYGSGNHISTGLTIYSSVGVHRWICCSCGFTEEWVDLDDIPALRKKYPKMNGGASSWHTKP